MGIPCPAPVLGSSGLAPSRTHLCSLLLLLGHVPGSVAVPPAWWPFLLQGAEWSFCGLQFHFQLCNLRWSAQTAAAPRTGSTAHCPQQRSAL